MNATSYFIKDRALSLAYEAIKFPQTSDVALAWLDRAADEAEKRGMPQLAGEVRQAARRVTDHEDKTKHFSLGSSAGEIVEVCGYVPA